MADYYSNLGVSRNCSDAELKKAYRRLAKQYHPDVNKSAGAEDKFKEIQKSYDTLKDKEKRQLYDTYGENWDKVQQGSGFSGGSSGFNGFGGGSSQGFNFDDLGDIFGGMFGGGSQQSSKQQQRAQKGEDITVNLKITPLEAINGIDKKNISFSYQEMTATGLPETRSKNIDVTVPKSIGNGKKLRLKGKGCEGKGYNAPAGDLYLKVEVIDFENYKVNGNDIYLHVDITPWEAILGTSVEIDTPFGTKRIKVPESTQSGKKLRIKSKGLSGGDFYIVYDVKLPIADTEEKKKFYNKMKELMDFNPRD